MKIKIDNLQNLTVGQLRKKLASAHRAETKSCDRIYALAAHGNERFSEICARLGNQNPNVIAHVEDAEVARQVELECRRRYGPAVPYRSMLDALLASRLRRRR